MTKVLGDLFFSTSLIERRLGSKIGYILEGRRYFDSLKTFSSGVSYKFFNKFADKYEDSAILGQNSDYWVHSVVVDLVFNGVYMFLADVFKYAPFGLTISYEQPVYGKQATYMPGLTTFLQVYF